MASVPVVIVGTIKDNDSDEERQVTITGLASIQGLHVGGGPIIPPQVPGIPTFPIAGYPDFPYPSNPIWLPGYPGGGRPPNLPGSGPGEPPPREPKFEAKVGWSEDTGWVVVFVPAEGTLVPTPSEGQ